jgi:hypothetical protein
MGSDRMDDVSRVHRRRAEGAPSLRVEWSERHEALNRNGRATWPTRFSAEIASEIC